MINFLDTTQNDAAPKATQPSTVMPKDRLLAIAKRYQQDNESERSKTNAQVIIQMCRRYRNKTPADAFGFWNNGIWNEHPDFQSLHNVPVFQQLIVGAESNFSQVDIRLNLKATKNDFSGRSLEKVAKAIYEKFEDDLWTETVQSRAFFATTLMSNAFFISRINKSKGMDLPVPQFDDVAYEMGGMAVCPECYATTDFASNTEQTCPECGSENLSILDEPETKTDQVVANYDTSKSGNVELVIASGLEVSVDPNGQPSDISSCSWVEWRVMSQKEELKRLYPHLQLEGTARWSYQTRLKKALIKMETGESYPSTESEKTEFELRNIWMDRTEYEGYVPPVEYKCGNKVIQAGIDLGEQFPDGMVFGVINDTEIAFIDGENKNKRIAASHWISDGMSFEGLGVRAGLPLQRSINQLVNIAMEGETRSLKGAMIYNPEAIDGQHLEGANTNIPLRPDFPNPKDLNEVAMPLNVQGLSKETLELIAMKKQEMQEVMGVPDVLLGQDTATDPTYGGQALRTRNALGLLTAKAQSLAHGKELVIMHELDLIQSFFPPAALEMFGTFLPDEIEAFYKADLEKDLTASYIPGTEVPESQFEKSMRLRQDVANQMIPLTPQLQAKLASESNYGAPDINNYESNLNLAEARYKILEEASEDPSLEQMFLVLEQQRPPGAVDALNEPLPNPIVLQLAGAIQIYPDSEDQTQQADFWSEKVRELAASQNSSPLLLALSDAMVKRHKEGEMRNATVMATKMGMASAAEQAPGSMAQAGLEQQKAEQQAGMDMAKNEHQASIDQQRANEATTPEMRLGA